MNISKRLCALTAAIVLSVGLISGYAEEGETIPAAEPEEEQQESVAAQQQAHCAHRPTQSVFAHQPEAQEPGFCSAEHGLQPALQEE